MVIVMSDMITDLFSKVFDTANIVNPVRQNHEDIGNAFDEESSAADANSADAEAASADTSDAKGVLADDQVKQSEAAEAESQAQQAASDAAKLFGDLQGIAEQLGEYATQMYLAFVAALSGGDADTINAASERASEANSQYTEAQNRADDAAEKSQEANERSEEATAKREDLDGAVAEDEETVAECEAAEAEIADEGASIGGDLDATRSDAEEAAQYDEQQEPEYYNCSDDNYGGDTGADPVNPEDTDNPSLELVPADSEPEPVDPVTREAQDRELAEVKIQNNEVTDEKMVEVMAEDIFSGDIANTSMDELVGLNAQDAIAKVNENLKAQSLYTGNISTTMDTASVDENQEAISDFYDAYLDIQDKLAQEGVEFLTTADEVNYAILAGIAEKLNASEYVMTAEIKKATSTADSIQVTTSDVTEVENKEAEIKGATLLKELEAVITDDPDAKEDENDDVLTQKEYDEEDNFFENAENKANAYEKLAKDAEKYNIFALAA